jgi:alkylated DNA repair dioxygenase AlkB
MKNIKLAENGLLSLEKNFLSEEESNKLFEIFQTSIKWEQKFFNKRTAVPRLTAWYADSEELSYSYSGLKEKVNPWIPGLLDLKCKVEQVSNFQFNSCLLNLYRDQKDSVGFHADDERELGINPNIASISLGETRKFILKQYRTSDGSHPEGYHEVDLTSGSLLIMSGATQHYWKHSIPKSNIEVNPRINLTFRKIIK